MYAFWAYPCGEAVAKKVKTSAAAPGGKELRVMVLKGKDVKDGACPKCQASDDFVNDLAAYHESAYQLGEHETMMRWRAMRRLASAAVFGCLFSVCAATVRAEDLSKAHDYGTVDISKLNAWELVYVPEKRKQPIFRELLTSVEWTLRKTFHDIERRRDIPLSNAPYCQALLNDLIAWKDVEIIEPAMRAPRYGDEAFAPWRSQCPKMEPHYMEMVTQGPAAVYGSHHFKAFRLPPLGADEWLFYFQGHISIRDMDNLGNIKPESSFAKYLARIGKAYEPTGTGHYRIVDLKECKITGVLGRVVGQAFQYHFRSAGWPYFVESTVIRSSGNSYVLSGSLDTHFKRGYFDIHSILPIGDRVRDPDCWFTAVFSPERD